MLENRPRSNSHIGATILDLSGRNPDRMTGKYWTDRLTAGDMSLTRVARQRHFNSLDEVDRAYPG
jgi:hypothetical protein